MSGDVEAVDDVDEVEYPEVPDWDDEYVDRVSDRIMFNYDLEQDHPVADRTFTLYGRMTIESAKEFFHPALSYGQHGSEEHLFVERTDDVTVADLERLVELGHDLFEQWVTPDEEHFSTDFTFAVVAPEIPEAVREFVAGFEDRNLLKYGYYGHYEVNLLVVSPAEEELVASSGADVADAFALWDRIEREKTGLLGLIARRFQV